MIADIYELSPLQAGMLFHRVFAPDSTAYFDQFSCRLAGPVRVRTLQLAWQRLVDRHSVLRTSFHWDGLDKPVQVVHTDVVLPFDVLDWRDVPADEQASRWRDYLAADRARGFSPDVAPLMRVAVARLSDDECYFCWSHHHLLLDGWCLELVLSEVFATYDALAAGREPALAPTRPFGDYIKWLQRRDRDGLERYWRDALAGFSAPTPLPAALVRDDGTGRAQADRVFERRLSPRATADLRATAARRRLTLSTLVQGAWALVLSRYSGSEEVVFGATVSGRPPDLPGIERMLGVFINTVPVRLTVPAQGTAAAWLADVQARHVSREAHAAIPLTDIQKVSDVAPGSPLFTTNVIVMNYRLDERLAGGGAGLSVSELQIVDQTDVPLTLQVTPGRELSLEMLCDGARFDAAGVERMLGQVEYVLAQFVEDLDRPTAAFDIVTPAERAQIMTAFNATAAPLDPSMTALDLFEAQVAATPDAIALECGDRRLTFAELDARANVLAGGLRAAVPRGAALGTDRLVALAFPRSEQLVAAILAVWKCGAAYVPIDPDYPSERIRRILDIASPLLVVRDEAARNVDLESGYDDRLRFVSLAELESFAALAPDAPSRDRAAAPRGGDLAYVIFTSGSTGLPKGAMVEHTGMLNHLLAKIEDFSLDRGSVIVQNASHCFDISVWQCFAAILAGGRTLVYTDDVVLDPAAFLERVRADGVTVLEVVPSYLAPLLDRADDDPRPLGALQWLLVTGETIKPSLVERWFARFPAIPMANAYGPTEASDDITHAILRGPAGTPSVPIGRPLRNFHIYIVDQGMRLCPVGVPGELCVSGPGVGRGYLGDPERTAAVFLEDPFRAERGVRMYRTGDVGWFAADSTLFLAGRRDHQVKVRGYRIELGDIEAALAGLPAVRDAVVVQRADRAGALAAYVTLRDAAATASELLDALADRLPDYMIPATCTVLAELPLTPNGKIDRKALPAPDMPPRLGDGTYDAPRTDKEAILAAIWADVLGVEEPGVNDNFFAAGGDSILSMQIVSRASRAGLLLTPRDVFQHQTIATLAEHARAAGAAGAAIAPAARPAARTGPAPLAPAQRQFFADVVVDRHHYNQSILLETPADVQAEHVTRAFNAVLAHHDALRLRFEEVDGEWRQHVAGFEPQQVECHDLSGLAADARAAAVDTIGGRVQASLDLTRGPVARAALFDFGAGLPGRLLIVVHHLAIDGVSWRTMLEDFATAYEAARAGADALLSPVATSYLEWAGAQRALPLVRPRDDARNTVASASEITVALDPDASHAFVTRGGQADGISPTARLAAALARAYRDWPVGASGRIVPIDIETHGREEGGSDAGFDLTRTVGWFTRTATVSVDLTDPAEDIGASVALTAVQLRPAADGRHAAAAPLPAAARPALLLNYHGRVDQSPAHGWRLSPDAHGPSRSERQQREYPIELNALVSDGQLRLTLTFSRNLHRDDEIADLARRVERHLVATVERADVEDVFPLSPTQQGLLFHSVFEQATGAYFNQLTCVIRGALDVDAFQRAWRVVTDRHAALRASFHWRGVEWPVQVVRSSVEIPWQIEDWTVEPLASPEDHDRRWQARGERDRRQPFDVSSAPLMRCALARTGPETWRFRWSQHHLLLDGWSSSIVLGDVLAAYDALVHGRSFDAPAPRPFRQYIDWLERRDADASAGFWRDRLAGFDAPTPLVLGMPEMDGTASAGRHAEAETEIDAALASRLSALAAAHRVTLNTVFQGVWALLLSRHGQASDVVFGSIASGRPAELDGADRMVGLFINTVPVRARVDGSRPVFEWLRDLQQEQALAEPHSYSSLADVQRQSEVPGGAALFESILIFENYPVASSSGGRALVVEDVRAAEPNNYPITLVVTPGRAIGLKIMFDEGRFDRGTIERTLGHARTLLQGIADQPASAVDALPMVTSAERALIESWNQTTRPGAAGETVPRLIQMRAQLSPDKTAVTCEGRALTYGALNRGANQLARVLMATGRGGLVAPAAASENEPRAVVLLRRSERLIETVLALWKCGAVYVPVDPEYPPARIRAIIESARPSLVIVEHETGPGVAAAREAAAALGAPVVVLDGIRDAEAAQPDVDVVPDVEPGALAYVIYTSGSTGAPKGAMVEHAGFVNHVLSMIGDLALDRASVVAQTASQCFDISMWQLFAALAAGGTVAIYPDTLVHRPEALAARFADDGVTAAQFVPSYLNVFLDAWSQARTGGVPPCDLPALRWMVTIGEALTPAAISRWFASFPSVPLMNAYGPTEASDSVAHAVFKGPVGQALVPIGRPIQNLRLYVVDRAMGLCPIGVKGEICIGGIGVGRGYLFDLERTAASFPPDPFAADGRRLYRTGDIGCYRPDGQLLFFGRRDHQVKVRGHRIELGEIEQALAAIDGVRDAVAVVHERGGDRLLCAYVTRQVTAALDAADVLGVLKETLPAHAVPDVVRVLDAMPVMPSGKIDRRALAAREVAADAVGPVEDVDERWTDAESALARIWSAVLGRERVGLDESFFDIGGHSLKAIQIVSRIHRDLAAEISVADLFEHQTIRCLARLVTGRASGEVSGAGVALTPQPEQETYDVSAMQLRMWLASRTPEGSAAYNMAGAFWLDGPMDDGALANAFDAVVARHEALRTVFEMREGTLRQRVLSAAQVGSVCSHVDARGPLAGPALDDLVRSEMAAAFDLARGPLVRILIVRVEDDRRVLVLRLHHIVGDAASIRVLLEEARQLYLAARRGDAAAPLPELTLQYRDFVAWQRTLASTGALDRSRNFWTRHFAGRLPRTGFAADTTASEAGAVASHVAACDMDAALTARVRATAVRHQTTVFGMAVAAVYALLYRYTQQQDLVIGSTISRRDDPRLEEQIGCYIDVLPLRGRADGHDTAADLIERTARVCRDALAHRDYPFDMLAGELDQVPPAGKPPLFDVLVDYVPAVRQAAGSGNADFQVSEFGRASDAAHYDSMFVLSETDDGTRLSIRLVFNARVFSADAVNALRDRLMTVLTWLASDAATRLADVELLSTPTTPRRRLRVGLNTG